MVSSLDLLRSLRCPHGESQGIYASLLLNAGTALVEILYPTPGHDLAVNASMANPHSISELRAEVFAQVTVTMNACDCFVEGFRV